MQGSPKGVVEEGKRSDSEHGHFIQPLALKAPTRVVPEGAYPMNYIGNCTPTILESVNHVLWKKKRKMKQKQKDGDG